ncbi:Aminotransferase-like, plant mobile domain [Sesbania bispinosa]|nr:Aminotransferase-like, plant mobile domain [Sesbania bispinosa]
MQFGMDQDVPGCVPEFNGTKAIAWKKYCRPISDRNLYFPSRLFEADVTTRYARCGSNQCWVIIRILSTILCSGRREVQGKSCDDSSNTRKGDNYPDVPPGFLPKRLKTVHSVQEGLKANEILMNCKPVLEEDKCGGMTFGRGTIDQCKHLSNPCSSASPADSEDVKRVLVPLMKPVAKENVKPSIRGLEENFEDANESKESRLSRDRVSITGTQGKGYSCASGTKVKELEHRN